MKTCYDRITSETIDGQPYYTTEVCKVEIERAKAEYESVLKEGFEKGIISKHKIGCNACGKQRPREILLNIIRPLLSGPLQVGLGPILRELQNMWNTFLTPFCMFLQSHIKSKNDKIYNKFYPHNLITLNLPCSGRNSAFNLKPCLPMKRTLGPWESNKDKCNCEPKNQFTFQSLCVV